MMQFIVFTTSLVSRGIVPSHIFNIPNIHRGNLHHLFFGNNERVCQGYQEAIKIYKTNQQNAGFVNICSEVAIAIEEVVNANILGASVLHYNDEKVKTYECLMKLLSFAIN